MEEYCYSGTIRAYRSLGIEMVGVPVDGGGMRTDALARTLERLRGEGRAPRFIYVLASYQNPTGHVMPRERRVELLRIAREHRCIVVEDNCYGDVHYDGEKVPALYALDDGPRQVYLCSLSKIFAPGVRIGYLTASSPELFERIMERRHDAGPNTLAAAITPPSTSKVASGSTAKWRIGGSRRSATRCSRRSNPSWETPARGRARRGGLFIWVRLPDGTDCARLEAIAAERGVSFSPGSEFHVEGRGEPCIRLAFGFARAEDIHEGIARLAQSNRGRDAPNRLIRSAPCGVDSGAGPAQR